MQNAPTSNAQSRLATIMQSWRDHPGRAPGGTGDTGLASTDARGYSDMLNEQQDAMNLQDELSGKPPVTVKQGRNLGGMSPSLGNSPQWWAQDMSGPFQQTTDSLPLSMRPFFGGR